MLFRSVSRLTEIPAEELNRMFASAKNLPRRSLGAGRLPPDAPGGRSARVVGPRGGDSGSVAKELPDSTPSRPPDATSRAERWILGILLLEPGRWMRVQHSVHVEDFTVPLHRRLAEAYWEHQRHEGEPVFNEFLGQLGMSDAGLVDLAMEAVDEVERLFAPGAEGSSAADDAPDREQTLDSAIAHLERARGLHEEHKLLAELRRTSHERRPGESSIDRNNATGGDDAEIALLKQLQEKARRPDLRRV